MISQEHAEEGKAGDPQLYGRRHHGLGGQESRVRERSQVQAEGGRVQPGGPSGASLLVDTAVPSYGRRFFVRSWNIEPQPVVTFRFQRPMNDVNCIRLVLASAFLS